MIDLPRFRDISQCDCAIAVDVTVMHTQYRPINPLLQNDVRYNGILAWRGFADITVEELVILLYHWAASSQSLCTFPTLQGLLDRKLSVWRLN